MIYKNGVKEYTLTTLLFGIPMGILFGIMIWNVLYGLISGVLCGLLFTLLMYLFVKSQEKKMIKCDWKLHRKEKSSVMALQLFEVMAVGCFLPRKV